MVMLHRKKKHHHHQHSKKKGDQPSQLYVKLEPMVQGTKTTTQHLTSIVHVNDERNPVPIDNEWFTGLVCIRVREYDGWAPLAPDGKPRPKLPEPKYFDGHKRAFSLQVLGKFKKPVDSDQVMFGTWFDKPLKLPTGYTLALRIMRRIDPSMEAVLGVEQPFMCSPLICAMNTVRVCREKLPAEYSWHEMKKNDWLYYEGHHLEENLELGRNEDMGDVSSEDLNEEKLVEDVEGMSEEQLAELDQRDPGSNGWLSYIPYFGSSGTATPTAQNNNNGNSHTAMSAAARRRFYLDAQRRKEFVFQPDTLYSFDFFSPYVDVNKMQVKLGIKIDLRYYLNDQPITYYARLRDDPDAILFKIEIGTL